MTTTQATSGIFSSRQLEFFDDENKNQSISIQIFETCQSTSFGLYLWPCAPVLGQYIWFHRKEFVGKHILEIGAGTSLPGLVAAKIGAQRVILCDDPKVELWTQLVRQTVTANSMIADRLSVDVLDWYDESTIALLIEKYFPHQVDLIFGSDIFFQKRDFETIICCLDRMLTHGHSKLKFYGTIERRCRSTMMKLIYLLRRWDIQIEIVPLHSFQGDSTHPSIVAGHDIILFILSKESSMTKTEMTHV